MRWAKEWRRITEWRCTGFAPRPRTATDRRWPMLLSCSQPVRAVPGIATAREDGWRRPPLPDLQTRNDISDPGSTGAACGEGAPPGPPVTSAWLDRSQL